MGALRCSQCEKRPAANGSTLCLPCLASAPIQPCSVGSPRFEWTAKRATAGKLCELCQFPTIPINPSRGSSYYLCADRSCGHRSATASSVA